MIYMHCITDTQHIVQLW